MTGTQGTPKTQSEAEQRAARLKSALKANLARRKMQAQARAAVPDEALGASSDPSDKEDS